MDLQVQEEFKKQEYDNDINAGVQGDADSDIDDGTTKWVKVMATCGRGMQSFAIQELQKLTQTSKRLRLSKAVTYDGNGDYENKINSSTANTDSSDFSSKVNS